MMQVHSPATYLYDYILTADTRVLLSLRLPPYNLAEPVEGHIESIVPYRR